VVGSFTRTSPTILYPGADRRRRAYGHQYGSEGTLKLPKDKEGERPTGALGQACLRSAPFRSSSPITETSFGGVRADAVDTVGRGISWTHGRLRALSRITSSIPSSSATITAPRCSPAARGRDSTGEFVRRTDQLAQLSAACPSGSSERHGARTGTPGRRSDQADERLTARPWVNRARCRTCYLAEGRRSLLRGPGDTLTA